MMFEQGTRIRVLALVSLGMLALVPAGVFASATSDASHVVTLPSLAPATITGEYHVTLNGTSSRDLLSDKGTAIYSSDGNIEVRPEMYDTAFSNARQIKIAVWKGNEPFWPSYKTMANGVDSYIYRFRMDKDKTYGMKIQIVTRDGKTVTPKNFPREFTWKTTATPATKPIGQIQPGMAKNVLISKADDLVSFRGVYGQPMELRFVRGNATELQFLHTGRRAPYSSLRTYRNYIALNGRWTETSSYAKNTAASKRVKFSASDKTSKDKVLVCDFKVTVPRGERYTVQTKQGDKWVLLAYLSNRTAPPVIVLPERPTPPTTPAPATRPKTITIERPGGTITISGPKALPRDYRIVADGSSAVAFEWRYTGNFSYGGLRTYATYIHHGSSYYAPSTYQRSSHVSKNFVLGSQSESPSGTVRWTLAVTLPSNSSYGLYKQDRAKGAWVLQARIVTPAATRPTRPTGHGGRRRMTLEEVGRLNQAYNNAYRRALALIAQGRSNTPEARKAHQDYLVAKAAYEQANTAYQAMQLRSITNPGSGSSRPHRPHRPRRITQADVDLAHQKHTAAYAEAMRLYHAGRAGTPEGKAAYAEHDRTRKVYLDTKAAFEKQPPVPTTTKPGTVIVTPVPTTPTRPPTKAELDWLYQEYLDARNKASILIDAEKGSTAEGREAYKNYEAAKDTYLKAKAAYDKAQTSTPAAASTVPTQAEVDKLYQEYIAAHNKLTYLMKNGQGDSPSAKRAYAEYEEARKKHEAAKAARDKADQADQAAEARGVVITPVPAAGSVPTPEQVNVLYKELVAAHDEMNRLIKAGQGNSAAYRAAKSNFDAKKAEYEAAVAARKKAAATPAPKSPPVATKPPPAPAPKPAPAKVDDKAVYNRYVAASNRYLQIKSQGKLATAEGQAIEKEYQAARAAYLASMK